MLRAPLPAVGSFHSDLFVGFKFEMRWSTLKFLMEERESNKAFNFCVSGLD